MSIVEYARDDSAALKCPEQGQPQLYVVDGQGRIRASFLAAARRSKQNVVATVHHLVAEQKNQPSARVPAKPPLSAWRMTSRRDFQVTRAAQAMARGVRQGSWRLASTAVVFADHR